MRTLWVRAVAYTIHHYDNNSHREGWTMKDSLTLVLENYNTGYELTESEHHDLLSDCLKYHGKYVK